MVKKCLVKHDELGKPIELVELKEFTDPKVLKEFKEKCELNKAQYLLRLEEKAQNEQNEKQEVQSKLENLQKQINDLRWVILDILGIVEVDDKEIERLLCVEDALSVEGEQENEEV